MSDEFNDLRLFTKMVSAGSLSETARRLNSSLTAMSRQLSQMEERLGVRLIDRGSRRFSLTEEGELLFGSSAKATMVCCSPAQVILRKIHDRQRISQASGNRLRYRHGR
jgi:hypothetical protein